MGIETIDGRIFAFLNKISNYRPFAEQRKVFSCRIILFSILQLHVRKITLYVNNTPNRMLLLFAFAHSQMDRSACRSHLVIDPGRADNNALANRG